MWPSSPLFYSSNPAGTVPIVSASGLPKLPMHPPGPPPPSNAFTAFPPISPLSESFSDSDSSGSHANTPQPNASNTVPPSNLDSFSNQSTVYSPLSSTSEDYSSPSPASPVKESAPNDPVMNTETIYPGGLATELLRNLSLSNQTGLIPLERQTSITAAIAAITEAATKTASSSSSSSATKSSSRPRSKQSHSSAASSSSTSSSSSSSCSSSTSSSSSSSDFSSNGPRKRKRWCPEKQKNYDRKRRLEEGKALNSLAALLSETDENSLALVTAGGQQQTRANVMVQAVETIHQLNTAIQEMETSLIQCEAMEAQFQDSDSPSESYLSSASPSDPPSGVPGNLLAASSAPSYFWTSDTSDPDALILSYQHALHSESDTDTLDAKASSNVRVYLKTLRSSLSSLLSKFHSRTSSPLADQHHLSDAIYSNGFVCVNDLQGRMLDGNAITFELLSKDSEGKTFDASEAVRGKVNCSIFCHLQIDSLVPLFETGCDEEAIFCALLFSAQKHSPHEKTPIPREHEKFLLENLMRVRGQATPRDILQCMRACSPNVRILQEMAALLSGRKNVITLDLYGYGLNGAVLKIRAHVWTLLKQNSSLPSPGAAFTSSNSAKLVPYGFVVKFAMNDCAFVTAIHRSECAMNIERTFLTEMKKAQLEGMSCAQLMTIGSASSSNSSVNSGVSNNSLLAALSQAAPSSQRLTDPFAPKDAHQKASEYRKKALVVLGASRGTFTSNSSLDDDAADGGVASTISDIFNGELLGGEDALFAYNKKLTKLKDMESPCGMPVQRLEEMDFPYKKFQRTPAMIAHARLHALGIPHRHQPNGSLVHSHDEPDDGHGDHPFEDHHNLIPIPNQQPHHLQQRPVPLK